MREIGTHLNSKHMEMNKYLKESTMTTINQRHVWLFEIHNHSEFMKEDLINSKKISLLIDANCRLSRMKTTPCQSYFHRFTSNRGVRNPNQYQEQG